MTIKRMTIDGEEATVAFIDDGFEPCEPEEAALVKVVFDSGDTMWLMPVPAGEPGEKMPSGG